MRPGAAAGLSEMHMLIVLPLAGGHMLRADANELPQQGTGLIQHCYSQPSLLRHVHHAYHPGIHYHVQGKARNDEMISMACHHSTVHLHCILSQLVLPYCCDATSIMAPCGFRQHNQN